ncbi:Abi family protein [Rubritalea tangerina]|uniref:Abi family protein n=1 Tax=Rubritalea tangerina TaxID=430798 RepID=A0ABW4Z8P9_9BACT
MPYTRPWLNRSDQLSLLKSRGLVVTDDQAAEEYLARIGYYRLSGYWYPYRHKISSGNTTKTYDQFIPDARFIDAVYLYVFDKKLRLLAMDALERIEIAIRVEIAHVLGEHDKFAHINGTLLDKSFLKPTKRRVPSHKGWVDRYNKLIKRSKEDFIHHYKKRHGLPLPIWVAIEIWDFGTLSFFYAGMKGRDRDAIARKFNAVDGRYLSSWLRSLNYLRNLCAHHSRLWNRNIIDQPIFPTGTAAGDLQHVSGAAHKARPFALFCILQRLMKEICPNSSWHTRFKEHMSHFPQDLNGHCTTKQMGCPQNWEGWSLWQ